MKYYKTCIILIIIFPILIICCSKEKKSIVEPTPTETILGYYFEFEIGNKWNYAITCHQADGNFDFKIDGIESWEVIDVKNLNDSTQIIRLETKLTGTYTNYPYEHDPPNQLADILTIRVEKGVITFIQNVSPETLPSFIYWLLKSFLNQDENKLCIYQPLSHDGTYHHIFDESIPGYTFFLTYTLEENLGFKAIEFRHSINMYISMKWTLIDFNKNSK
jgi:hypothetical protein